MKSTPNTTHSYTLNSLSKQSKSNEAHASNKGRVKPSLGDANIPTLRWDNSAHHTSVESCDQRSTQSHESKQMIISKNTQWTVDFECGLGRAI